MARESDLNFTGERFHPEIEGDIELEHVHRYLYALEFCKGLDVLDLASGEGYGSALLAEHASSVVGMDISAEAVKHARQRYTASNLNFYVASAAKVPAADASVDVVVSFETIEHHDEHEAMLAEIRRVLKPNGILIISSPDKEVYTDKPNYHNPFHVKELYKNEFVDLVRRYFSDVSVLGQRVIYSSVIIPEDAGSVPYSLQNLRETHPIKRLTAPMYNLIIASSKPLVQPSLSVLDDTKQLAKIEQLESAIASLDADLAKTHAELSETSAELLKINASMLERNDQVYELRRTVAESQASASEYLGHLVRINSSPWWRLGMWITERTRTLSIAASDIVHPSSEDQPKRTSASPCRL